MANPEHLQILQQGVKAWNQWREQHEDIIPDLGGADLFAADLTQASLGGADLRGAFLARTNLSVADLTDANLSDVDLLETVFGDTNLTAVRGLETCNHGGPSILDHRTLARSGPLPLAFLRGCGLPEALIEYLPSILGEPFQFYSCFISYASKDDAFAKRLHADLQNHGVRCWFAPEDMKIATVSAPGLMRPSASMTSCSLSCPRRL
jgi:uncharacterized protein YjbI with pentapeptide repeats